MPKAKTESDARCVLTLPLITERWQEDIIETRFEIIRQLQNALIGKEQRKLRNLERRKDYRAIMEALKDKELPKEERKDLYAKRRDLLWEFGFRGYFDFIDDITPMQKHYVEHIGTNVAHQVAVDVWRSFEKYLYGNGKAVHFKRYGSVTSAGNRKYGVAMTIKDGCFVWSGGQCKNKIVVKIPIAEPRTDYERRMLEKPIRCLRVVKKWMKKRWKYYLQLTLEGSAVKKERKVTEGRVGLDMGTQAVAVVSETEAHLIPLADMVTKNEAQIANLRRKMDRSRRSMNPDNYNPDGTIKRGVRLTWIESNHYRKMAGRVRELMRKNADIRKYQHRCLAVYILSQGNYVIAKPMQYKELQMRKKETEKDAKGRCKSKKRFGKVLANRAPAEFESFLKQKLLQYGGQLDYIDNKEFKVKQYDHLSEKFRPRAMQSALKTLENGDMLHPGLYAAFLMRNADSTLKSPDKAQCDETYEDFKRFHEAEMERLRTGQRINYDHLGA